MRNRSGLPSGGRFCFVVAKKIWHDRASLVASGRLQEDRFNSSCRCRGRTSFPTVELIYERLRPTSRTKMPDRFCARSLSAASTGARPETTKKTAPVRGANWGHLSSDVMGVHYIRSSITKCSRQHWFQPSPRSATDIFRAEAVMSN